MTSDLLVQKDQRVSADQAKPDHEIVADGGLTIEPSQFIGTWEFLRTVCHDADTITFVDYSYRLQLQETQGTALDTTAVCMLTTSDFPIKKTATGYELDYGNAASFFCTPNPCTLEMKTKVGTDITTNSYSCPDDFPVESIPEVIVSVEGTTLTTQLVGLPCESLYQKSQ